jgi:hypothetical protein
MSLQNNLRSISFHFDYYRNRIFYRLIIWFFLCIYLSYSYPAGWSDDILINADTLTGQNYPDIVRGNGVKSLHST